jgi:hypothetical protein
MNYFGGFKHQKHRNKTTQTAAKSFVSPRLPCVETWHACDHEQIYPILTLSPANLAAHGLDGALNTISASIRLASPQNNGASTLSSISPIRGKTTGRLPVHQMSRIPPSTLKSQAPDSPDLGTTETGRLGVDTFGTRASFQGALGVLIRGDILDGGVS